MKPMIQGDSLSGGVIFQIKNPLTNQSICESFFIHYFLRIDQKLAVFRFFSGIWKSGQQKNADLTEFVYEFCFLTSLHGFCLGSFKF